MPFSIPVVNYTKVDRPTKPRTHILAGMTYIYTVVQGWSYLLTFMDMYTRKILAWDIDTSMTAKWVTGVAIKVIEQCPDILYLHSDQGCQYTSKLYLTTLLESCVSRAYSSKESPYHNAWIESFHAQLKKNASTEHRYTIIS